VTHVSLVFFFVLLHELGHSLMAKYYGVEVESITLLPIGGMAAMRTLPNSARAELHIAMAGPAVSLLLGTILLLGTYHEYGSNVWSALGRLRSTPMIVEMSVINLALGFFNLVPAFPMDGGRILRAALWSRKGFERATEIAVKVGQVLAGGLLVLSLLGFLSLWVGMIAVFIYLGAESEKRSAAWREAITNALVADVMQTQIQTVGPNDTIDEVFHRMMENAQDHFPVVAGNEPVGMLAKLAIVTAMQANQANRRVSELMSPEVNYCTPLDSLVGIIQLMDKRNLPCVLVLHDDKIVGLMTAQQVWRYRWDKQRESGTAE
jgi:Zn-dependent protease/CBS domain-containing protein